MIAPAKYKKPFLEMGFDENTAGRYGMIVNIDDNMGLLMAKLEQWGLPEKTLLIFMTDNGQAGRGGRRHGERVEMFRAGLKNGKGSPNEGGTRVPAFWRWKGVLPEGQDQCGRGNSARGEQEVSGEEQPRFPSRHRGQVVVEILDIERLDPKGQRAVHPAEGHVVLARTLRDDARLRRRPKPQQAGRQTGTEHVGSLLRHRRFPFLMND